MASASLGGDNGIWMSQACLLRFLFAAVILNFKYKGLWYKALSGEVSLSTYPVPV